MVHLILANSTFRTSSANHRAKGSQTFFKPARQLFHSNLPLISDKLTWKTSVLVKSQILELFFKTFTAYHIFSRQIWEKFLLEVQTQLISKSKKLFWYCYYIYKIYIKYWPFWKKRSASLPYSFWSYWLWSMWLLECLKVPVLEHPSAVNVLWDPKHFSNLNRSAFILIFL